MLLFWRKGFAAASMHDLCDAMGVRSPSLYAAFESKEALYLAAIEHYVRDPGPAGLGPACGRRDRARRHREAADRGRPRPCRNPGRAPAGCMAVLAPSATNGRPRSPASSGRSGSKCSASCARGWKLRSPSGELPASTDIDALSRFYLSVFQGMAIQAKDGATPEELRGVAEGGHGDVAGRAVARGLYDG